MKWLWLLLLPFSAFARIDQNGDFQVWARSFTETELSDHWAVQVWGEMRWGDNASKLFYNYLQGQIVYRPAWWMFIAPGYRQGLRRFPLSSNHWEFEYAPIVDVAFILLQKAGWEVRDRNRVEYILFDSDPNHWLYRNRLRVITPWTFTGWNLNPYIENEVFWRQARGVNQDRVSTGFMMQFSEHVGGETSYILRLQKQETGWVHQNVLNLMLVMFF
jgi:hypothetical protein